MPQPLILIVDDDSPHRSMLRTVLRGWGYAVEEAEDGAAAVEQVRARAFDAVLTDVRMARLDGIAALREIREWNPSIPVLIMTAWSSVQNAVDALRLGAYDYLTKPLELDELKLALERALDHTRLARESQEPGRAQSEASSLLLGRSEAMRELVEMVETVAPTEATVLVSGESGTGKELVARAIQAASTRRDKPFVTINCAALAENLLESELFGHEKGAFTGADSDKAGLFQAAEGGTLFLDEIGNLAPVNQMKLLRALQEKRYLPVGTVRERAFDIRLIAATNADLEKAVAEGSFREDLYHRLNEFTIRVPLLSECGEDILPLAEFFLKQFSARYGKSVQGFDREAAAVLRQYGWPGNIRELKNTVRRAVVFAGEGRISAQELNLDQGMKLGNMIVCPEKEEQQILRILGQTGNNRTLTARVLGISRTALYYKLRKYGIV